MFLHWKELSRFKKKLGNLIISNSCKFETVNFIQIGRFLTLCDSFPGKNPGKFSGPPSFVEYNLKKKTAFKKLRFPRTLYFTVLITKSEKYSIKRRNEGAIFIILGIKLKLDFVLIVFWLPFNGFFKFIFQTRYKCEQKAIIQLSPFAIIKGLDCTEVLKNYIKRKTMSHFPAYWSINLLYFGN